MKPGRASQTAVRVCMGRALAHAEGRVPRFSDPTAASLLPEGARLRVERARAGGPPRGLRERYEWEQLRVLAHMMVARTIEIDEALRAAAAPQVVILGAGLDGRAWRMPELEGVTVFEVDHPDSQRDKRARAASLPPVARDVRFVAVDFQRDALGEALAAAGHDPERRTTWVWEGVVMYLTRPEIEATLAVIEKRSAPGSRLIVAYHSPAWMLHLVGVVVRRLGEPLRSTFVEAEMRALLARFGFAAVRDEGLWGIAAAISPEVARHARWMKHLRIVTADRAPSG